MSADETWLRTALAPVSDFGRRASETAPSYGPGDEAEATAALARIVTLASLLQPDAVPRIRAAVRTAPDITAIAGRARAGDVLDAVDFYELARFADAVTEVRRLWDAAGGDDDDRPPSGDELAGILHAGRIDGGGFRLDAAFDSALGPARAGLIAAEAALTAERARLAAAASAMLGIEIDGDEFVVLRDRLPGPLPAGVRVVRETPSYRLCALDLDAAAVAATAARDAALAAVLDVETTVRRRLSEAVGGASPALRDAAAALGRLDVLLARVAFTQRWGGAVPAFTPRGIALEAATLPPLAEALARDGRPYVPIDVALEGVAVLTGPNMGGKSAALATVAFAAACVARGVPPPARNARLPLYRTVSRLGGGERDRDRARLLSAFGVEVVAARDLFAAIAPPALVLVDEFARTTAPREGRALLVAVVEALQRRGIDALVATHFDGVAEAAGVAHLAIAGFDGTALAGLATAELPAALEALGAAMDYRVVPAAAARSGGSGGLLIARALGLAPELVERAEQVFDAGR